MSYIVLARKYRPADFDEVIGQEHITELLKKTITLKRVAHAYLFCGPRGIGKTSCARILAKSLNCKNGPTLKPCGKCPACLEIAGGNSFDVLEIDGASNRGIDEIRTIRENVKFAPSYGNYKIYIVDEVHMLTMEAFNALLKTLEEPPEHVKFIFATTDPNKLPPTIISRCQRYDFRRIKLKTCVDALLDIAKKEKFKIDQDALYAIAKAAQGSFRDALSIMDQISALSARDIKTEDVYSMLGLVEMELMFELVNALANKDCSSALKVFDEIVDQGKDIKQLTKDLIEHFRNLMIMNIGGKGLGKLLDYPIQLKERYLSQSKQMSLSEILNAIDFLIQSQETARITESFRTPLEIAFAKMTFRGSMPQKEPEVDTSSVKAKETGGIAKPKAVQPDNVFKKNAPVLKLKDEKGQVNASTDESASSTKEIKSIDLSQMQKDWNAMTYAVSRQKMSLATYLQEGSPIAVEGDKIKIAFNKDFEFYKDSLETSDNVSLVERVFSEYLGQRVLVKYAIVEHVEHHREEEEPEVKAILDAVKGKIVSRWHDE